MVILRNDLRVFKLRQKGMLSSVDYLILTPKRFLYNATAIYMPFDRA